MLTIENIGYSLFSIETNGDRKMNKWTTEKLKNVVANITTNPSPENVQTELMSLSWDETVTLGKFISLIENIIYDRQKIYDEEGVT